MAMPSRLQLIPRRILYAARTRPSFGWIGMSSTHNASSSLSRYFASKSFPPHTIIHMPALSPTMTQGNIGSWKAKIGDKLEPGVVLVEIETDKAQMDFEFQDEGRLAKVLRETGEKDVPVGAPIGVLVESDAEVSAFESFTIDDAPSNSSSTSAPKDDTSSSQQKTESTAPSSSNSSSSGPSTLDITPQESDSSGARLQTVLDRGLKISPAVKNLALEKGVPINQIKGSGKGGQITKQDIEKYQKTAAGSTTDARPSFEDSPASSMRKTIANRLTESMQKSPHYFVQSSVSVSKLLKLRSALNTSADGAYKLSVNDFLIKAIALAAIKVPAANSSWREDVGSGQVTIRRHNTADVSVAVATPAGLLTPVVKNAHSLGLETISKTVKDLGKRARDNKLKPDEYQGGTITISNMGMNDAVERFTAVINPPQATIIAIGTVKKVAVPGEDAGESFENGEDTANVRWDDQIVFSGSFDHKVVDGAVGGEFMRELKRIVEDPLKLLL